MTIRKILMGGASLNKDINKFWTTKILNNCFCSQEEVWLILMCQYKQTLFWGSRCIWLERLVICTVDVCCSTSGAVDLGWLYQRNGHGVIRLLLGLINNHENSSSERCFLLGLKINMDFASVIPSFSELDVVIMKWLWQPATGSQQWWWSDSWPLWSAPPYLTILSPHTTLSPL